MPGPGPRPRRPHPCHRERKGKTVSEEQPTPEEIPVKERAEALRLAALASHGYLAPDGEVLDSKIEDVIFDCAVKAVVSKTAERKTITVRRTALTRTVVPNMPGPGEYDEVDDPEAAALAWDLIHTDVWRMCDVNPNGRIQSRLNGEHALVLCRTKATGEKGVEGIYVTRDWACLKADFVAPDQRRVELAINRQAANAEMVAERLPEHGKKVRRELTGATKTALSTGVARVDRMIGPGDDKDDE